MSARQGAPAHEVSTEDAARALARLAGGQITLRPVAGPAGLQVDSEGGDTVCAGAMVAMATDLIRHALEVEQMQGGGTASLRRHLQAAAVHLGHALLLAGASLHVGAQEEKPQ